MAKRTATATATTTPESSPRQEIEIPKLTLSRFSLTLVGESPGLLVNRFSEKAKEMMAGKQQQKVKQKKEPKNPEELYRASLYILPGTGDGTGKAPKYGFPTVAFKAAVVNAAADADYKKTDLRRAFFVEGDMTEIVSDSGPRMYESAVRLRTGVSDLRYRGLFDDWKATLTITYNTSVIRAEDIVYLFSLAGFGVGVGEFRPQRNGNFGRFHVATESEVGTK